LERRSPNSIEELLPEKLLPWIWVYPRLVGLQLEDSNSGKTDGYGFVVISSLPLNICIENVTLFTDHVGYMVELACFNLFLNAIVLSILRPFWGQANTLMNLPHLHFHRYQFVFCSQSSHEFYAEKSWRLVIKSVLMVLFLKVSLEVYRGSVIFRNDLVVVDELSCLKCEIGY